ncbi:CUB and sushi domain-containing protein 1-like [Sycon ciliatum]|uniref:CUB and sushi domain-containing protein 1-like n=1 Tax=Sycon ciliatum TaxID=27933 RepID=UPI0031F681DB
MLCNLPVSIVTCPNPGHTPNALRHGDIYTWQHNITYECITGYYAMGSTTLTCTQNGNWSSPSPPKCIAYTCDTNFSTPADAETLTSRGDFVPDIVLRESDVILTSCHAGFESANTKAVCRRGQWEPAYMPNCRRTACNGSAPMGGANTVRSGAGNTFGSVHSFRCLPGFDWLWPWRAYNATCQHDMRWSSVVPDCSRVVCPSLAAIANGVWLNDTDAQVYEDSAPGACSPGYVRTAGNLTRTCMSDGTWSGTDPVCTRVKCPISPVPDNGRTLVNEGNSFGDMVSFSCDDGYEIASSQSSTLVCQANKTWSDEFPVCKRVTCAAPAIPAHTPPSTAATPTPLPTSTASFDYGHVYSYVCDVGHYLIGANNTTCSQTHNWTNPPPTCQAVECNISSLPTASNAYHDYSNRTVLHYNESIVWSCDQGYELQTTNTTAAAGGGGGGDTGGADGIQQCTHYTNQPGYFSGTTPRCVRVSCPLYPNVTHAISITNSTSFVYEDVISIHCLPGHETATGGFAMTVITCLANGTWSENITRCTPVQCAALPSVPHALHSVAAGAGGDGSGTSFGTTVSYRCESGYRTTAASDSSLTCQHNRTWDGSIPVCTGITCPAPALPQASVALLQPLSSVYNWSDSVEFSCIRGYQLRPGSNQSQCSDDGMFTHPHPGCDIVQCPQARLLNAILSSSVAVFGDIVTATCNLGYEIKPGVYSLKISCEANGSYNVWPLPSCSVVECGALPDLLHANSSSSDVSYGSLVTVTCDHGYVGENATLSATYECAHTPNTQQSEQYDWVTASSDLRNSSSGCKPVQCQVPTVPNFNQRSMSGSGSGSSSSSSAPTTPANLLYTEVLDGVCDLGYELTGGDRL